MSTDLKYTAFIIDSRDAQGADRIYTLYTEEQGKVRVLGKGVKKNNAKLAGNLELIMLSDIMIAKGKGIGKITGSIPVDLYPSIKKEYESSLLAMDAFKKIDQLIQGEERDEKIFLLLRSYLENMEKIAGNGEQTEKAKLVNWAFFIQLLDQLGYHIGAVSCISCGKKIGPQGNFFNFSGWGISCPDCVRKADVKISVGPGEIKFIRLAGANRLENMAKIKLDQESFKNMGIVMEKIWQWMNQ